jgi:hypothetical protein
MALNGGSFLLARLVAPLVYKWRIFTDVPHLSKLLQEGVIEGSLEVKHPTIWTDGKAEVGRVREEINDSTTKTYVFPTLNCGRKQ